MYNKPMRAQGKRVSANEQGFAAIIIAIVLIVVLGLLTVGFAELMRSEQRNATEKHLSNQAYYAAEAGINDAAKAINDGFATAKTSCDPLPAGPPGDPSNYLTSNNVDGAGATSGVSYSCLIIDPAPPSLEYSSVDDEQSKVVILQGVNYNNPTIPEPIGKLYIGWQDSGGNQTFKTGPTKFDTASNWTYTGVMRINLLYLASGSIVRQNMIDNNLAAFLYPNQSGAATAGYTYGSYIGRDGGGILNGNCKTTPAANEPRYCGVYITGLNYADYLLTLRSIYKQSRVTIKAYDLAGNPVRIRGAQTLVDSTGKAQDVVRRVQARIPSENNYPHPDFDLETMDNICKQYQFIPGGSPTPGCTP